MQHPSSMWLALAVLIITVASATLLRKTADVPKPEPVIKNPMEDSVGDVLPDAEPPDPKGQQYDITFSPVSPKAAPDLSPTDPYEYVDAWEGYAAQTLDHMSSAEGRKFEGSTCESVCSACTIWAKQQQGGMCWCYATCQMGDCGKGSGALPHIGWSNNEVTTPRTTWQAKCNIGTKNCQAECAKDEFKKEVKKCENSKGNPTECWRRLSQLNQPLPYDSRKQLHHCARKGMSTCDSFMNAPTDGGWLCYNQLEKCKEKVATGFKFEKAGWQAPSVWKSVR
jgi:hypothetical protein